MGLICVEKSMINYNLWVTYYVGDTFAKKNHLLARATNIQPLEGMTVLRGEQTYQIIEVQIDMDHYCPDGEIDRLNVRLQRINLEN